MATTNTCTQYDNYGPRRIHYSGIKIDPYDWMLSGVRRANGQTFVGDGTAQQPAPQAMASNTPSCRSCHGGC